MNGEQGPVGPVGPAAPFPGWLNVKTPPYGATGDATADDTAAISAALRDAALAGGAVVFFPPGKYRVTATLDVPALVTLQGSGMGSTWLWQQAPSGPLLRCDGERFKIRDLSMGWGGATRAGAGSNGIVTRFDGQRCPADGSMCASEFEVTNVELVGFYDNLWVEGSTNAIVNNLRSHNAAHDGVVGVGATWGYWSAIITEANKRHGLCFDTRAADAGTELCPVTADGGVPVLRTDGPTGSCFSPFMSGLQTYANGSWGLYSTCQTFVGGAPSFFNNDSRGEIHLNIVTYAGGLASPLPEGGHIANADLQWAGDNPWAEFEDDPRAPGIHVGAQSAPVRLSDLSILGSRGNGIWLEAGEGFASCAPACPVVHQLFGVRILGSGIGLQEGHLYAIRSLAAGAQLNSVVCENPSQLGGNNISITSSRFTAAQVQSTLHLTSGGNITLTGNFIFQGLGPDAGSPFALEIQTDAGVSVTEAGNVIAGPRTP